MQGPALQDFSVAFLFGFGFLAAHCFLDRLVFRRLAIWFLRNGNTPLKITDKIIAKIAKISESLSKFTYYATVETYALRIMYSKRWFTDRKEYFKGWPDQELEPQLKLYYMCQCAFYLYSIAVLLKWETRRKDFAVMMSHHVITVILIGYSYLTGFFRIGFVILALHDASDVLMEVAKAFKYSGNDVGASVFFGLFALSWLILRLIIYPFWVIRASSYDVIEALPLSETYVFTFSRTVAKLEKTFDPIPKKKIRTRLCSRQLSVSPRGHNSLEQMKVHVGGSPQRGSI
ncbi:hypothetical protein MLD38_013790 [Melastoma candidum]|uniref:Uncharacterized protein n=1 Tax=Melastoma candidum TaxID=119954 RepID=A0ACB9RAP6_9MYRT|nr:hypothetical protein MLD38_013790 [Melastoma candidum]